MDWREKASLLPLNKYDQMGLKGCVMVSPAFLLYASILLQAGEFKMRIFKNGLSFLTRDETSEQLQDIHKWTDKQVGGWCPKTNKDVFDFKCVKNSCHVTGQKKRPVVRSRSQLAVSQIHTAERADSVVWSERSSCWPTWTTPASWPLPPPCCSLEKTHTQNTNMWLHTW